MVQSLCSVCPVSPSHRGVKRLTQVWREASMFSLRSNAHVSLKFYSVWSSCMVVLVCSVCHHSIPQTGWLQQQKSFCHNFQSQKSKIRVLSGLVLGNALFSASSLFTVSLHGLFSVFLKREGSLVSLPLLIKSPVPSYQDLSL